jgi:hypothetical protein
MSVGWDDDRSKHFDVRLSSGRPVEASFCEVASVFDARVRIGHACGTPTSLIRLVDRTGTVLSDADPIAAMYGRVTVVITGSRDEAWKELEQVCNYINRVYTKLTRKGNAQDLVRPTLDMFDAQGRVLPTTELFEKLDATKFKNDYNQICQRAFEGHLSDQLREGFRAYGRAGGIGILRKTWNRPDAALKVISPTEQSLSAAFRDWDLVLNGIVDCIVHDVLAASSPTQCRKRGLGNRHNERIARIRVNDNATDNLGAMNSLVQLLFSSPDFRGAVLRTPCFQAGPPPFCGTGSNAKQLAEALYRLFVDMADPCLQSISNSRDVAMAVYKIDEIGLQQDPDDLLYRLSSTLDDSSKIDGDPYSGIRCSFRRQFMGATGLETSDARGSGLADAEPGKDFLSIPLRSGSGSITAAFKNFTTWNSQRSNLIDASAHFWMLPEFLIFSISTMFATEFEDVLNLAGTSTVRKHDIGDAAMHLYDVHATIVHQGNYASFIREPDGRFLFFNDERVSIEIDLGQVRDQIMTPDDHGQPPCVRMIVYRSRIMKDLRII